MNKMEDTMKKKLAVYLAGGMEKAKGLGSDWRSQLTPFLEELDLEVFNPCEFEPHQLKGLQPKRLPEFYTGTDGKQNKPTFWHDLKNAQEKHLYSRFLKYMRRIIHYDIKVVRHVVDYVIVLWDGAASKGAGTHSEMTLAFLQNTPVYCVEKVELPAWSKACCTEVFKDFDSLKEFLKEEFDFGEETKPTTDE